jgi:transposase
MAYGEEVKLSVLSLSLDGVSPVEISKQLGIHKATIHRWIKNVKNHVSLSRKIGSGRKPKLDERTQRALVRTVKKIQK